MKILILDHHELFRDGLKYLLLSLPGGEHEFLEAGTFSEGLICARRHPDLSLVVLELKTPGCKGVTPVKYFRKRYPHIPLLIVSGDDDFRVANKALLYGANEFVSKSSSGDAFLAAVRRGLDGGNESLQLMRHPLSRRPGCTFNSGECRLTRRQMQVLKCLSDGMLNKEIATELGLAQATVKVHVAALYRILRVGSRIEAVRVTSQLGIAPFNPTDFSTPRTTPPPVAAHLAFPR